MTRNTRPAETDVEADARKTYGRVVCFRIEQPVRAFVDGKTVAVQIMPAHDLVRFGAGLKGFDLDIERAQELHQKLGEALAAAAAERQSPSSSPARG